MKAELALKILDRVSLALSIAVIGLIWRTGGFWPGFQSGASVMCNYVYSRPLPGGLRISFGLGSDPFDPYFRLSSLATNLAITLFIFALTKLFENKLWFRTVSLVPLGFAVYFAIAIDRIIRAEFNADDAYLSILGYLYEDLFVAYLLLGIVVVMQIASTAIPFYTKRATRLT